MTRLFRKLCEPSLKAFACADNRNYSPLSIVRCKKTCLAVTLSDAFAHCELLKEIAQYEILQFEPQVPH